MVFLLFSIFINVFLYIIFKEFVKYKIDTLQAITVNYFVAFFVGTFNSRQSVNLDQIFSSSWFLWTFVLGAGFIIIFNLLVYATQKGEVSMVSIFTKMSLVLPAIFGIFLYNENVGWVKFLGITMALVSIYLASKKDKSSSVDKKMLYTYVFLFFITGIADTLLKYVESNHVRPKDLDFFISFIFFSAGVFGVVILLLFRKKIYARNILAGCILGIPNYFSMYFFVKVLKFSGHESSMVFLYNNLGIVILSLFVGQFIYGEKLTRINWLGIIMASSAIVILSFK